MNILTRRVLFEKNQFKTVLIASASNGSWYSYLVGKKISIYQFKSDEERVEVAGLEYNHQEFNLVFTEPYNRWYIYKFDCKFVK